MKEIKTTVQVSSDVFWPEHKIGDTISDKINKLIDGGYQLLHIGQNSREIDGNIYHSTIAILGKTNYE